MSVRMKILKEIRVPWIISMPLIYLVSLDKSLYIYIYIYITIACCEKTACVNWNHEYDSMYTYLNILNHINLKNWKK